MDKSAKKQDHFGVTEHKEKITLTEENVARYHDLNQQAKQIELEMVELKKAIHAYFDTTEGKNAKGDSTVGNYRVQRQIRESDRYEEEKTVKLLEELNLTDCIQIVKRPDQQKIKAAITLGLLEASEIEECIVTKISKAIVVRKTIN